MASDRRTRYWTSVIYRDSAPDNWREIIEDTHVKALVSPLHAADVNGDGTEKKEHRHIVWMYDSVKTYEQVCEDIAPLNGTIPQRVKSLVGTVRYLTHLDNPEKAQYNREDVIEFGGAHYDDVIKLSQTDRHMLLKQMRSYIVDNDVLDFCEFVSYCDENNDEWSRALDDTCTLQITQFIKSRYLRRKRLREDAEYKSHMVDLLRIDEEQKRLYEED